MPFVASKFFAIQDEDGVLQEEFVFNTGEDAFVAYVEKKFKTLYLRRDFDGLLKEIGKAVTKGLKVRKSEGASVEFK